MFLMIIFMLEIIFLILILIFLNLIFSNKKIIQREKLTPIECGFNMMNKINLPFSIQFYYISILFLIFDIEISLILPMIQKLNNLIIMKWTTIFNLIMILLIFGLYIEWMNNLIKWF